MKRYYKLSVTWKLTLSDGHTRLHKAKDVEPALSMFDRRNKTTIIKIERLD